MDHDGFFGFLDDRVGAWPPPGDVLGQRRTQAVQIGFLRSAPPEDEHLSPIAGTGHGPDRNGTERPGVEPRREMARSHGSESRSGRGTATTEDHGQNSRVEVNPWVRALGPAPTRKNQLL